MIKGTIEDWMLTEPTFRNGRVSVAGWLNGTQITTSYVTKVDGRVIDTFSGSRYRLGRIDPVYRRFLESQGVRYDARQPITLARRGARA